MGTWAAVFLCLAASARAQTVRVAPAPAPVAPGVAGAAAPSVPLAGPGGAQLQLGVPLPEGAVLAPTPARVQFVAPENAPAAAAQGVAGTRTESRTPARESPAAQPLGRRMAPGRDVFAPRASREAPRPMTPPEPESLALSPSAALPRSAYSAGSGRAAALPERAGSGAWTPRARRALRSAAAWLKAAPTEDPVRTLEGLFSGSLRAGANSRPAGPGDSFAPSASPESRDSPPAGAAAFGGRESAPAPAPRGSGVAGERPAFGAAPFPVSAAGQPASALATRGAAFTPFESSVLAAGAGAPRAAASPAPPRSLRLAFAGSDTRGSTLELRILEGAPARTLALAAESVTNAAVALNGAAESRLAFETADRLLRAAAPPPSPAGPSDHGWLAYWTAAAASRVLIARN